MTSEPATSDERVVFGAVKQLWATMARNNREESSATSTGSHMIPFGDAVCLMKQSLKAHYMLIENLESSKQYLPGEQLQAQFQKVVLTQHLRGMGFGTSIDIHSFE
jgi:hypothetical protein